MRVVNSKFEPFDYCRTCALSEEEAQKDHGDVGNREDDDENCFEYNADHPDYGDEEYHCDGCGRRLTEAD